MIAMWLVFYLSYTIMPLVHGQTPQFIFIFTKENEISY